MSLYTQILQLHDLAVGEGKRRVLKRDLYAEVIGSKGRHFVGIVGPRGAGKTILLKQIAASDPTALYLSADTLPDDADLFVVVKDLADRYKYQVFLIDEIHFLPGAMASLKQIYDFLEVRVMFTSSVALAMQATAHDLSRRVRMHALDYFSFREFLHFAHGEDHALLSLDEFLGGKVSPGHLRAGRFFVSYLSGGLLPFAMEEADPMPLLAATLEKIIERDIPQTLRLRVDELSIIRKLVAFVGRSAVDGINYSSLSTNLGITKYKAEQYVDALEKAFVLQRILPAGTNLLREPKVLLMPPVRLLHLPIEQATGGLREDFFAFAIRQAGIAIRYLKGTRGQKTPDFLIEHRGQNIALEIGGRGKGRSQFKGISADRKIVLAPDIVPQDNRLPLHLLGFLSR
ncbi:MAG: AAA family ATPase [Verrucomicrobia bacterium]|nr:AAA family ATPase [Verrucomicrobiota bacterium]